MAITYLPPGEQERVTWLNTFSIKLPTYGSALGLSTTTLEGIKADAAYYAWTMQALVTFREYAQAWTSYKDGLANGTALGEPPILPTLDPAPTAVAPDVFGRLAKLVTTVKNAPGYTESIGKDLGIITPKSEGLNPNTLKPVLKTSRVALGEQIK